MPHPNIFSPLQQVVFLLPVHLPSVFPYTYSITLSPTSLKVSILSSHDPISSFIRYKHMYNNTHMHTHLFKFSSYIWEKTCCICLWVKNLTWYDFQLYRFSGKCWTFVFSLNSIKFHSYLCHSLSMHSSVDGNLEWFCFMVTMNISKQIFIIKKDKLWKVKCRMLYKMPKDFQRKKSLEFSHSKLEYLTQKMT